MLTIYRTVEEIPSGIKLVRDNDAYFNAKSKLLDTELVKYILGRIDGAEYVSEYIFCSKNKKVGNLNKIYLSTGTKTLLNIINSDNVCFDLIECGINVLDLIPEFSLKVNGSVLWSNCFYPFEKDCDCDILYRGMKFSRTFDFMRALMEEDQYESD